MLRKFGVRSTLQSIEMTRTSLITLAATLLLSMPALYAQQSDFHCGANELERMGDLVIGHPERLQEIEQARMELEHFTQAWEQDASRDGNQYVIPVVFHIIHNNGPENISNEQVYDAIRVMNEDWNQQNSDWMNVQPEFLDRVANMQVTFKLAKKDPNGNCTSGITRTESMLTNEGGQQMKNLIRWPRERYLNIWVAANAGGAAGYSMYPSSVSGSWGAAADGIVILGSYVGAIGTSNASRSHALSHEAGHWLNLKHLWGDSNDPGLSSNCNTDDGVSDTPNTVGWTTCTLRGASCGSALDNVENFMEYSYCSKMFTAGQKARVHAALNSSTASRNNLWTAANLAFTGVNDTPQLCEADFISNRRVVCVGQEVTFTDVSYNGVTERSWTFDGASPATATTSTATVTYAASGTYSVTLTVSDGSGSLTTTREEYITVLPEPGAALPVMESFEGMSSFEPTIWEVADQNSGSFAISGAAAYTGSQSVRLTNNSARKGNRYELMSTTIDNTSGTPLKISFRYAFAKRTNSNNDALRVYASRDCGESWSMRKALIGNNLTTAPNTNGTFTPNGPDQWGYVELPPLTGLFEVSSLRLKFVFESDGGNNLWLDDINLNSEEVGIGELEAEGGKTIVVVPNPAQDRAEVSVHLRESGTVKVELVDLLGRPVRMVDQGTRPAGLARWTLDLNGLPGGMYFVRVQQGSGVQVAKFTKE